jgi:uncharacterized protein (DUF1800 family)
MERFLPLLILCGIAATAWAGPDQNGNQLSDIWEVLYNAPGLVAGNDNDGDGYTNAEEEKAGTNPLQSASRPSLVFAPLPGDLVSVTWDGFAGKNYELWVRQDLDAGNWLLATNSVGAGEPISWTIPTAALDHSFFRLGISDPDSDGDTLTDWEERLLGFNPGNTQSQRLWQTTDDEQVAALWDDPSTVTVGVIDAEMREDWPDPAVFVIRRSGGLQPITVSFTITGTATRGTDYTTVPGNQIQIPLGAREVRLAMTPIEEALAEGSEDLILTITGGTGYSLGSTTSATATITDASTLPGPEEAARFLIQAGFGPDQDNAADPDIIPENVEAVMSMGFDAWIDGQIARPVGLLQPWVDWVSEQSGQPGFNLYGNWKQFSWWGRAMGSLKLRPDAANNQLPDPLRQRVAFALSEILVVSDRPEQLAVEQRGVANYYDLLVTHAFGNYEDLLYDVATHPAMGMYLSHLNNQKANPALKLYPDENFAREIMQLFTIGLWELNEDGTRKTYPVGHAQAGQPIPTYDNDDITELARVFTGLTFADKNFPGSNGDYTQPMKMWDASHDCEPKTLLGGLQLPARTPSSGNTGTAGLADVAAAVKNLFNHPNVGPFLSRQLIQRLVTSNPSPAYVGRVAAKFANNGMNVRGDLGAVVKAILLDPEAREASSLTNPAWGKMREPFLRVVNLATAFNAASQSGHYALDQFTLDHLQDPMSAPSVFNYFLPGHSPPGELTQQGYVAPEFQILNASTAITGPNYFRNALAGNNLHRYGSAPEHSVRLNLDAELAMIVPAAQIQDDVPAGPAIDPDPLLRRLDLVLTGGTLEPEQFQIIREAMLRIPPGSWEWHRQRLNLAIYLIVTSAEFNVLR